MTHQEVFDAIVEHLRQQKATSTRVVKHIKRDEIESALRGDDGRKCPGGFLITDEEYNQTMENGTFGSILKLPSTPQSLKDRHQEHAELVDALVFMHDWSEVSDWEREFADIASAFRVKFRALKKPAKVKIAVEEVKAVIETVVIPVVEEAPKAIETAPLES